MYTRTGLQALLLCAAAAVSSPTQAATTRLYYFNANCEDCAISSRVERYGVLGLLKLRNYADGLPIDAFTFAAFSNAQPKAARDSIAVSVRCKVLQLNLSSEGSRRSQRSCKVRPRLLGAWPARIAVPLMQNTLFPIDSPAAPPAEPPAAAASTASAPAPAALKPGRSLQLQSADWPPELHDLAAALPPTLRLGTSSWSFPGWTGLVWGGAYSTALLAKRGLAVYARHPLLRTVSLDRAFYQPLTPAQYAAYAEQVPNDFRFVVKAPSVVADALVRGPDGRGLQSNAGFLDPALAWSTFVEPALQGLQGKTGALVFQLSPLPTALRARMPQQIERLGAMLAALPPLARLREQAPDLVIAVEVRDPAWLVPAFADVLRAAGATYCLGLHARMPPIEEQLPVLRALWPGPLVCRWSLHRSHGAQGYEEAKSLYEPFDQLVDPDPATRAALARVARATSTAGHPVYITINNKAEGSAPRTVEAMARLLVPGDPAD